MCGFFYKSSCLFCVAFLFTQEQVPLCKHVKEKQRSQLILQIRQQPLHSSRSFCMYQAGWHLLWSSICFGSGGIPAAQDHKPLCSLLDAGDERSCGECSSSHCFRALGNGCRGAGAELGAAWLQGGDWQPWCIQSNLCHQGGYYKQCFPLQFPLDQNIVCLLSWTKQNIAYTFDLLQGHASHKYLSLYYVFISQ